MKFHLEKPEHGWVRVRTALGSKSVEFLASDVPNNPVAELIGALQSAAVGKEASVWWHLEPEGWYFEFQPVSTGVHLRLLFSPDSEHASAEEHSSVTGSKSKILLPIWHGLREFESYGASEPHWPSLELGAIQKLRAEIES